MADDAQTIPRTTDEGMREQIADIFANKLQHYDGGYASLIEDLRDDVDEVLRRVSKTDEGK